MGSGSSPLASIGLAVAGAAATVATGGTALPALLAAGAELAGGAVSAIAGSQQAGAEKATGEAQEQEDNYESVIYNQKANQDQAAAQRKAIEIDRQGNLVESTAIARAAASGGDAEDPSIMGIIGNLEGQKTYQKQNAIYQGDVAASDDRAAASNKQFEGTEAEDAGDAESSATTLKTIGGGISSAASLYGRYGRGLGGGSDDSDFSSYDVNNGIKTNSNWGS
jgi:hypothetical protein